VTVDQNPAALWIAGMTTPASRDTCRSTVRQLVIKMNGPRGADPTAEDWPHWPALMTYARIAKLRQALADEYDATSTANRFMLAARAIARQCRNLGLIDRDALDAIERIKTFKWHSLPAGRVLTRVEIADLMGVRPHGGFASPSERTDISIRDRAVIALLYGCGLRRAELVALDLNDHDDADGVINVRGKGRRDRAVPINAHVRQSLKDWYRALGDADSATPMIPNILGRDSIGLHRITGGHVARIVAGRAERARIAHCSPHDLRRSCATHMLDSGVDIAIVRRILGHASLDTTVRYDRRGREDEIKAVGALKF